MPITIPQRLVRCLRLNPAIDVIPEVDLVAAEMRRVTRSGGVVACGTQDFWDGNSVLDLVLDTGAVLDESIRTLRAQIKARPIVWANGQAELWRRAGLVEVVEVPIVLSFDYTGFEDYWSSFSTGPTRIAQRLTALPSGLRSEIEQYVRAGYLAGLPDGPRFAAWSNPGADPIRIPGRRPPSEPDTSCSVVVPRGVPAPASRRGAIRVVERCASAYRLPGRATRAPP